MAFYSFQISKSKYTTDLGFIFLKHMHRNCIIGYIKSYIYPLFSDHSWSNIAFRVFFQFSDHCKLSTFSGLFNHIKRSIIHKTLVLCLTDWKCNSASNHIYVCLFTIYVSIFPRS